MTHISLFHTPGLFLAWGLKGGDLQPESLANRAADAGFKWVCQEFGDPNTEPNADVIARLRASCHARGIQFGIWEVTPRALDRLNAIKPNFWVLNVEDDYFDYGPLLSEFRATHPRLEAGVITNCGLNADPFIAHNVKAIPEAYTQDNPNATPQNMVNRCHEMGWKVAFPCLGC